MQFGKYVQPFRVTGGDLRLADYDPGDAGGLDLEKKEARELLASGVELLADLQARLYADDRWSLLVVFQAMDAAGKDSAIKHVMSGVNPQGCEVHPFKVPTAHEIDHDFLWRASVRLPARGHIGIFNRSYYEEVLVVRVHPEILDRQKLPPALVGSRIFEERLEDIRSYERYLGRNGTAIIKFFLNVSKDEQKRRFLERIDNPEKHWKFALGDIEERKHWSAYMTAYEDAIRETATQDAPWYVVPADKKWFTRLVVAGAIIERLAQLGLEYPRSSEATPQQMAAVRKALLSER
jgi:PPK2 family polyphosphate:nucleotide phosphotransferase